MFCENVDAFYLCIASRKPSALPSQAQELCILPHSHCLAARSAATYIHFDLVSDADIESGKVIQWLLARDDGDPWTSVELLVFSALAEEGDFRKRNLKSWESPSSIY